MKLSNNEHEHDWHYHLEYLRWQCACGEWTEDKPEGAPDDEVENA